MIVVGWISTLVWLLTLIAIVAYRDPHIRRPKPIVHKADYAKIARLEVELGLVEAPKPKPRPVAIFSGLPPPYFIPPMVDPAQVPHTQTELFEQQRRQQHPQ